MAETVSEIVSVTLEKIPARCPMVAMAPSFQTLRKQPSERFAALSPIDNGKVLICPILEPNE